MIDCRKASIRASAAQWNVDAPVASGAAFLARVKGLLGACGELP